MFPDLFRDYIHRIIGSRPMGAIWVAKPDAMQMALIKTASREVLTK